MRVELEEHHPTQLVGLSNALDLNQGFVKAVGSLGSLYKYYKTLSENSKKT